MGVLRIPLALGGSAGMLRLEGGREGAGGLDSPWEGWGH